jgi:hypothetical protein
MEMVLFKFFILFYVILFFILFYKELYNVGVIYAESGKELTLETIKSFKSNDVMVVGEDKTNYTCKYINNSNYILYIESNKSFIMDGGLLKYGIPNSGDGRIWNYFCILNESNSYFNIRYITLKFVSQMSYFTYITGGVVCIEYLKIESEVNNWASTLFYVVFRTSSVIVELFSIHITNCYYNKNNTSNGTNGIFYINGLPTSSSIILNISSLFSYNNIFSVGCNGWGGCFHFRSYNSSSGFSFLLLLVLFLFAVLSCHNSTFLNYSFYAISGGFLFHFYFLIFFFVFLDIINLL